MSSKTSQTSCNKTELYHSEKVCDSSESYNRRAPYIYQQLVKHKRLTESPTGRRRKYFTRGVIESVTCVGLSAIVWTWRQHFMTNVTKPPGGRLIIFYVQHGERTTSQWKKNVLGLFFSWIRFILTNCRSPILPSVLRKSIFLKKKSPWFKTLNPPAAGLHTRLPRSEHFSIASSTLSMNSSLFNSGHAFSSMRLLKILKLCLKNDSWIESGIW